MSETVGQHSVATFTSPVNGTSPIDANTVKGNDNTLRSAYVDHDADPGIHVQSSTLASRPVANSAGRKWMTQDSGVIRLFYDDGTSWYEVDYLRTTGGTISGNLSISGTLAVTGVATFTAQPVLSSLTASQAVFTDASKGLVSNAITGTGNVVMSASPTLTGTIGAASMTLSGTLGVTGLLTFASLKGTGATTVTNILDEDNMASDSATALATQQSIKAYVDAQVGASDALSEVLAIGNTTGANDIIVSAGQKIRTPAVAAGDGTSAITIANTTGALTLASALADSNLATISTAGKVSNSATTATSANTASAIVARDSSGNFTAGTITATLSGAAPAGSLSGTTLASNVVSSSLTSVGTLTSGAIGSGFTAIPNSALANSSVTVNGTAIALGASGTVTAAAGTLTGTTLASNVVSSSLTSVGTLSSLTVSGDLTVDTSTLKVDSTNNRVGIGTASPLAKLEIFGLDALFKTNSTTAGQVVSRIGTYQDTYGSANQFASIEVLNGSPNWYNGGALVFKTNSGPDVTAAPPTEKMRLDASGRLGIGTASPSTNLHVSGSGSVINLTETSTQYAITRLKNPTHSSDIGVDNTSMYLDSGGAYPIIFYTGSVSTEKMRLDASGNLGLGTSSPGYRLTVAGASGSAVVSLLESGVRSWGIRAGGAATNTFDIADFTAGVSRLTIDSSGNLGLGVTPSGNYTLQGTANYSSGFKGFNLGSLSGGASGGGYPWIGYNLRPTSTADSYGYNVSDVASAIKFGSGINFYTAASGTAGNTITFTQAMTLDASGNLGVGATPSASYRVFAKAGGVNAARFESTNSTFSGPNLLLNDTTHGVEMCLTPISGAGAIGTYSNHPQLFYTNNAERARITSGGYFKASNNGTYVGSTGSYHELRSTSSDTNAVELTNASASPYGLSINFTAASPDNNTNRFFSCGDSTTARMYVYSDGDLANHDGVYGTISDERLKQDIVDAGSQWDDLKAIRFRKYRMKTDVAANPDAPAMLGVVAQELEQVSPGLVDEHPDFEEREVTDEDGNVTTERVQVGTTKTVKSSILLMKAAVALQEAMARIESLEARLAALEN
jgi:hypothetical protein